MSISDLLVPNTYDIFARSVNGGGGGGGGGDIKKKVVTVGATQLLALPTTPIELIAPIAGTMIEIVSGICQVIDNGTPTAKTAGAGSWAPAINYGSTASLPLVYINTGLAGDQIQFLGGKIAGSTAKADVEFKSISLYNESSDLTVAGDSGLEITLYYTEVQLLL